MAKNEASIYVLRIDLDDTSPKIWRKIEVPSDYTFRQLHEIIQVLMGWTDYHLHEFAIRMGGKSYMTIGDQYLCEDGPCSDIDEFDTKLSEYLDGFPKIQYIYDFGDDWRFTIKLEKVIEPKPGVEYPYCTGGKNTPPPEDCGGVYGYYDYLSILEGEPCPERDEVVEWFGEDFDPCMPVQKGHIEV